MQFLLHPMFILYMCTIICLKDQGRGQVIRVAKNEDNVKKKKKN